MKLLDYIRLALKNLSRQKSRTILTIIAITVGSLFLIIMVSTVINIRTSLVDQFQELGAFNLVTVIKDPNSTDSGSLISTNGDPSEGKMITDATLTSMKALDHVVDATPIISGLPFKTVRLEGSKKKTWANISAYDPDNDVMDLPLAAGRKLKSTDMDKIFVGSRFMQEIGFKGEAKDLIGKKVILNSYKGGMEGFDWGPPPEKPPINADKSWYEERSRQGIDIPVEIVGISSNGNLDGGGSYISLAWARRLLINVSWQFDDQKMKEQQEAQEEQNRNSKNRFENNSQPIQPIQKLVKEDMFPKQGYTTLILKADDTKNLKSVAKEISKLGYGANTAEEMIAQINKILAMVGAVLALIGGISLFVAAIGIINTMIMATYERTREIGVMRACGATRAAIRRLFTFEAALLGFWGGVFGVAISFGLGQIAKLIIDKYQTSLSNIPVDKIGNFPLWLILAIIGFTTLLGMMSGLYPAIRAARMDPVEALRYE